MTRALLGRSILVQGIPSVVIGVMREGFRFPAIADLWHPLALMPGVGTQARDVRTLGAFGRLADGVHLADAREELRTVAARLARDYPQTNSDVGATAITYGERLSGRLTDPIPLAVISAAAFVLLVVCANVANLLLARAIPRTREITIRAAMGATRWHIVRQLLVESVLLGLIAGPLGLLVSRVWVRLVADEVERAGVYWMNFTVDPDLFAFLAVLCLGTSPSWRRRPASKSTD